MTEASVPTRSQGEKFIAAARALECDEDEDRFKAKLRKIAKAKPAREKTE